MSDDRRAYVTSHPWISFSLRLDRDVPYALWVLLGAAESKCKHLAGIPLRPEKQRELQRVSLIKGVHATTAIEGNSLTVEDVAEISAGRRGAVPESKGYQRQEIENMLDAYVGVAKAIARDRRCDVTVEALKSDDGLILRDCHVADGVVPGEIRTYPVVVSRYRGAPAEDCEHLLRELFDWLDRDWGLGEEHPLLEEILKAIVAHLYVAWIHPFGDGNGRAARLLEFRVLMNAGVPLTAAHLLTSYYNETRDLYHEKLAASTHEGPIGFIMYALRGFVDALDGQIESILREQLDVTWENYVHKDRFGGKLTPALRRRRDLLLEISALDAPVSSDRLRLRLSDGLLGRYRERPRALARDLNALEHQELLRKEREGWIAAKESMKAFLPLSNVPR